VPEIGTVLVVGGCACAGALTIGALTVPAGAETSVLIKNIAPRATAIRPKIIKIYFLFILGWLNNI
jgi:hypothetical protein